MSLYAAIATLKKRLLRALAERDGWRDAGDEEKYREACSVVQALTEQLEQRELAARGRTLA
jgi:hypothetical protein